MFTLFGLRMELERRITVKTSEKLHKAVRVGAAEMGRPISEIVRTLLEAWIAGRIELPPAQRELWGRKHTRTKNR